MMSVKSTFSFSLSAADISSNSLPIFSRREDRAMVLGMVITPLWGANQKPASQQKGLWQSHTA